MLFLVPIWFLICLGLVLSPGQTNAGEMWECCGKIFAGRVIGGSKPAWCETLSWELFQRIKNKCLCPELPGMVFEVVLFIRMAKTTFKLRIRGFFPQNILLLNTSNWHFTTIWTQPLKLNWSANRDCKWGHIIGCAVCLICGTRPPIITFSQMEIVSSFTATDLKFQDWCWGILRRIWMAYRDR